MSDRYRFTLYIAGRSPRSEQAVANLERICAEMLADCSCDVSVVDVLSDPDAAERHRILATPTLIKESPAPLRRITGDLSDPHRVLMGLALAPHPSGESR